MARRSRAAARWRNKAIAPYGLEDLILRACDFIQNSSNSFAVFLALGIAGKMAMNCIVDRGACFRGGATARGSGGRGRPSERFALENVVGQGVPGENDERLGAAAHGKLHQSPLPETAIDAFVDRALAIGGFADLALHPLAPCT